MVSQDCREHRSERLSPGVRGMASQFIRLFAVISPILRCSPLSFSIGQFARFSCPSPLRRQLRRMGSMGTLSVLLATSMVHAEPLPRVQGEPVREDPGQGESGAWVGGRPAEEENWGVDGMAAIAGNLAAATATDYLSKPPNRLDKLTPKPSQETVEVAQAGLETGMSSAVAAEETSPAVASEVGPRVDQVAQEVDPTVDQEVRQFAGAIAAVSVPAQRYRSVLPRSKTGLKPELPVAAPAAPNLAATLTAPTLPPPPRPGSALIANRDSQGNLGLRSASPISSSVPLPVALQPLTGEANGLPVLTPAMPFPGYEAPAAQVSQAMPSYPQQGYVQPGYPSPAPYGYGMMTGYPAPQPLPQPTYYLAYPAPLPPGMPQGMMPQGMMPQGMPMGMPIYLVPVPAPMGMTQGMPQGMMPQGMPMYPIAAQMPYPVYPGYPQPYPSAYGVYPGSYPNPYANPYATAYPNPYPNPYATAYPNPYLNPYATAYPNPYANNPATPVPNGNLATGNLATGNLATLPTLSLPAPPLTGALNGTLGGGSLGGAPVLPSPPSLYPPGILPTPTTPIPIETSEALGGPLPAEANATALGTQMGDRLPEYRDGQLLRTSALGKPEYRLQGVFLTEGSNTSARARLNTVYPLTPNLLFGGSLDVSSGDSFSSGNTSGFSVNELYASASLEQLPNLRFVVGQMDLTSYFDRNSFAKDSATHFFNEAFQTNPALSAAGLGSRPGLLLNWTATDNIELKAAAFSSDRNLGGFALDGFAGEIGLRYGNAIVRGSYVTDKDSGNRDGFQEIFSVPRSDGGSGLRSGDREQAYGVNAEYYIPNLRMGLFARYGRYENRDLNEGGDSFGLGFNFQDVFSADDRIGLAYGRTLSNESLRRQFGTESAPDVLELFYDFRFLPNLRLGFSLQERNEFSEIVAGFRLKAEFDTLPLGSLKQ